jgi:hypothetical protein
MHNAATNGEIGLIIEPVIEVYLCSLVDRRQPRAKPASYLGSVALLLLFQLRQQPSEQLDALFDDSSLDWNLN